MRPAREIMAAEDNFRVEEKGGFNVIRRDPVQPEPVGTIILKAFRITAYDRDCDGSLMARLDNVDHDGNPTGWSQNGIGLDPSSTIVVTTEELTQILSR